LLKICSRSAPPGGGCIVPVSEEEHARLVGLNPIIGECRERLRMVEALYADPAMILPAAPHD